MRVAWTRYSRFGVHWDALMNARSRACSIMVSSTSSPASRSETLRTFMRPRIPKHAEDCPSRTASRNLSIVPRDQLVNERIYRAYHRVLATLGTHLLENL